MRIKRPVTLLLAVTASLAAALVPYRCASQEILVSAASSLTDVFREIGAQFARTHHGVSVRFNFGASGALQRQIEQGAPVDVFASAGTKEMDALEQENELVPGSRRNVATNRLVLIAPAGSRLRDWQSLENSAVKHIAIADPESAPAGRYARDTLHRRGLWDALQSRFVIAQNVRQALTYVAAGDADAGLVFATDARQERTRVTVVAITIPGQDHAPILYPAAVIASSHQRPLAAQFVQFLLSGEVQRLFRKYGFTSAESGPRERTDARR